jgi:hypothetical protein
VNLRPQTLSKELLQPTLGVRFACTYITPPLLMSHARLAAPPPRLLPVRGRTVRSLGGHRVARDTLLLACVPRPPIMNGAGLCRPRAHVHTAWAFSQLHRQLKHQRGVQW